MKERWKTINARIIPVALMAGYVPLVVHVYTFNNHVDLVDWMQTYVTQSTDLYLAYKSFAIIALAVVMLIVTLLDLMDGKREWIKKGKAFYLLLAYGALVFLSGVMTPWRWIAFTGGMELFLPVPTVLGLIVCVFYSYGAFRGEADVDCFVKIAAPGVGIALFAIVVDSFGYKFVQMPVIKWLVASEEEWEYFDVTGGRLIGTLYNEDIVAMYLNLVLPMAAGFFFYYYKKKKKVAAVISAVYCLAILYAAHRLNVDSYKVVFVVELVFAAVVLTRYDKKLLKKVMGGITVVLLVGVVIIVGVPTLREQAKIALGMPWWQTSPYTVENMQVNDEEIVLYYRNGHELYLTFESVAADAERQALGIVTDFAVTAVDETGANVPVSPTTEEERVAGYGLQKIEDERFHKMYFFDGGIVSEQQVMSISYLDGDEAWKSVGGFAQAEGKYYYVYKGKVFLQPEKIGIKEIFPNFFMSWRGHMWDLCLTKVLSTSVLGMGSNCYLFGMPRDYLFDTFMGDLVDVKPHNSYFQQWLENGGIAFVCWLMFFGMYLFESIKLYRKPSLENICQMTGVLCMIVVAGYLVSGLVNDTMVTVAPYLWTIVGLGLAVNRINEGG